VSINYCFLFISGSLRTSSSDAGKGDRSRGGRFPPNHGLGRERHRGRVLPKPSRLVHLPRLHERPRVRGARVQPPQAKAQQRSGQTNHATKIHSIEVLLKRNKNNLKTMMRQFWMHLSVVKCLHEKSAQTAFSASTTSKPKLTLTPNIRTI